MGVPKIGIIVSGMVSIDLVNSPIVTEVDADSSPGNVGM